MLNIQMDADILVSCDVLVDSFTSVKLPFAIHYVMVVWYGWLWKEIKAFRMGLSIGLFHIGMVFYTKHLL